MVAQVIMTKTKTIKLTELKFGQRLTTVHVHGDDGKSCPNIGFKSAVRFGVNETSQEKDEPDAAVFNYSSPEAFHNETIEVVQRRRPSKMNAATKSAPNGAV